MLLEAMGLHVPGSAFVHPHAELREQLTREAVRRVLAIARDHVASEGRRQLPDHVLEALLWPPRPSGPKPVATARAFGQMLVPAWSAGIRAPGLETGRFVARKVYESAAATATA